MTRPSAPLLGDGTGKLDAPVQVSVMNNDEADNQDIYGGHIAAADLNGDGLADLVAEPGEGSGEIAVLLNVGGSFPGDVDYTLVPTLT